MALLVPELLDTPRLRLRPFAEDDLDAFAAITADAQTMRFIGEGVTADRMLTWRWLATTIGHWQMRGYGPWAVEEKASGALLGRVGLWRPEGWPGVEVMWTIRRSSWGRGFAPEAAAVARDAAFEHLPLDRLCSLIVPENTVSIRVAEKIGESHSHDMPMFGTTVGVYTLDRADWKRSRA